MAPRPQHPSGRPIRRPRYVNLPIRRVPFDGPLTPGLRTDFNTTAIGFHVDQPEDGFDDDDCLRRRHDRDA